MLINEVEFTEKESPYDYKDQQKISEDSCDINQQDSTFFVILFTQYDHTEPFKLVKFQRNQGLWVDVKHYPVLKKDETE